MEQWKNRWGLVFAAMGAAIGTGNIWRFPKEAAANGGGAFLILWLIFLFTWSIPLLIAEFSIGKHTRLGTIGTFKKFVGKRYAWMGAWMVMVSALIGFYYAVVMGWVLRYLMLVLSGNLHTGTDTVALWNDFMAAPYLIVLFQLLALLISCIVVYIGVRRGIELVNKILIPSLFVLLLIAAVWALTLPNAIDGLRFLFVPRMEYLGRGETWVRALAQSAWSCSAGMGMAITYAIYMSKKEDTALNSFITGLGNNAVSLIAGIAVICTVFGLSASSGEAVSTMEAGTTSLTFIHLTRLFIAMPGGVFIAGLFFMGTAFAALTSMISGLEIATRNFMDHGWSRHKSLLIVASATFILGLPSALIITHGGVSAPVFLENQDFVWGTGLILSGLFVAFAVWKYGVEKFRAELINTGWNDIHVGFWWEFVLVVLFPIQFLVLMAWFFLQSFQGAWWNPFAPNSFATIICQWLVLICILLIANEWIGRQIDIEGEA